MKSNVCVLKQNGGRENVLKETEKTAAYCGLSHKEMLRLSLLAEELTGMTAGMVGDYCGSFWIEEKERSFELHLKLDITLNEVEREKLLEVSTSGKNAAGKGFMERLRMFVEDCIVNYETTGKYCSENGMNIGNSEMLHTGCSFGNGTALWSLNQYRQSVPKQKQAENWDGLEKSVVVKLADDIIVGIHGKTTEITVIKKF